MCRTTWLTRTLATLVIACLSGAAFAHHSHGNYKIGEEIRIQGIVTKAHLANPHVWLFMDVVNDLGEVDNWALEAGSLSSFRKSGWGDISAGDNLTVLCVPTRDSGSGCFINDIVTNAPGGAKEESSGWTNIAYPEEFFSANFPSEPDISEVPYLSEYGGTFPSTMYTAYEGDNYYSVTVVDFSDARNVYTELAEGINVAGGDRFWIYDQIGAIAYAARQFRLRGGDVTYDAWHHVDRIEGHQLFITNPDLTKTYAGIYRHANRLYILEATVTADAPPQGVFQQSLTILDENGKRIITISFLIIRE